MTTNGVTLKNKGALYQWHSKTTTNSTASWDSEICILNVSQKFGHWGLILSWGQCLDMVETNVRMWDTVARNSSWSWSPNGVLVLFLSVCLCLCAPPLPSHHQVTRLLCHVLIATDVLRFTTNSRSQTGRPLASRSQGKHLAKFLQRVRLSNGFSCHWTSPY